MGKVLSVFNDNFSEIDLSLEGQPIVQEIGAGAGVNTALYLKTVIFSQVAKDSSNYDSRLSSALGFTQNGFFESFMTTPYAYSSIGHRNVVSIDINAFMCKGFAPYTSDSGCTAYNGGFQIGYITNLETALFSDAKKVIISIGESVSNPNSNITKALGHMHSQACQTLRNSNYYCRLVSFSRSGKTMLDLDNAMKRGEFLVRKADIIIYQMGINDAVQRTSQSDILSYLNSIISFRDTYFKNAKLVFISANEISNISDNAYLNNTIRPVFESVKNINNNIYHLSLQGVLTDLTSGGTQLSDGAHPKQSGHDLCGNVIGNFLKTII